MSFGGHVMDMIARMKNNRAQRPSQRGKFKEHLQQPSVNLGPPGKPLKFKELDSVSYEAWRQEFLIKKKSDRSKNIKRFMLLLVIIGIFTWVVRLWAINELQFLGYRTDYATAEVFDVKWHHIGRGYYMQTVYYAFEQEGQRYTGHFEAGYRIGKLQAGDLVKVKYARARPEYSKFKTRLIRVGAQ